MADHTEFVEHVLDLMAPLGGVTSRKMFGGWGFFKEGSMFSLVTRSGVLHLRADDVNRPAFERRKLKQFMRMPYFEAPEECLDDSDELCDWARPSVESAARSAKKKTTAKKKARPRGRR